nr:MAG TPA: hypothetical protein [Caudoviricetes sp.]
MYANTTLQKLTKKFFTLFTFPVENAQIINNQ